jgi:osmotically-inducible protein OsmY
LPPSKQPQSALHKNFRKQRTGYDCPIALPVGHPGPLRTGAPAVPSLRTRAPANIHGKTEPILTTVKAYERRVIDSPMHGLRSGADQGHAMRSDAEIRTDVESELRFVPGLDASGIAIAVKDGVVTLAGFVAGYADKLEAEAATERVKGVVGVANDIVVRLPSRDQRPDPEIAREAVAAIKNRLSDVYERIKIVVKDGWLGLEGEVEWDYQRVRAERAVRRLKGVKGVTNLIEVQPVVQPDEIKCEIEKAFRRSAEIEANQITVETHAGEVIPRHGAVMGRAGGSGAGRVGRTGRHPGR